MAMMFTKEHRLTGKLERVQSYCCEAIHMFVIVDYVREMTVKKS